MNSKLAGIYSITSKVNGKRYIGSAIRICDRWSAHLRILRLSKHHSQHLQNHYHKYGEEDLIFTVLEVIERGDLSLSEFKRLLLNKEQVYLDNWICCEFNVARTAGSCLGLKHIDAKYYIYMEKTKMYMTYYTISGKSTGFSRHIKEEDAIAEIEYMKTLSENDLLDYKQKCREKPKIPREGRKKRRRKNAKHYSFHKGKGKWGVQFQIEGKLKYFGYYVSEEEAIAKVQEVIKEYNIK